MNTPNGPPVQSKHATAPLRQRGGPLGLIVFSAAFTIAMMVFPWDEPRSRPRLARLNFVRGGRSRQPSKGRTIETVRENEVHQGARKQADGVPTSVRGGSCSYCHTHHAATIPNR